MTAVELAVEAKRRLAQVYGPRLRGVVLHGSQARGDARPGSDTDLLVLVDHPGGVLEEIRATNAALYPLELEADRLLDAHVVDADAFEAAEYEIFRRAQREGVRL